MSSVDPYLIISTALKQILDAEFAPAVAVHDNLHESLGYQRAEIGIAPLRDVPRSSSMIMQETWVEVKYYDLWDPQINNEQSVNPQIITAKAHRFREALRTEQVTFEGSPDVWFFDLTNIEYPNDPTGNKTRFVATIRAFGDNAALVETRG